MQSVSIPSQRFSRLRPMASSSTLLELILVEHFKSPLSLTMLDMADWALAFSKDYPNAQQLPTAPPVDLSPVQGDVQFRFAPAELPRLILRSLPGDRTVQLQADRFAIGWSRTKPLGELDDYPGYDVMKAAWFEILRKFHDWHNRRFGNIPVSRLIEIGYQNADSIEVEGRRKRLSEIFLWVQPSRPVNSFNVAWSENVSPEPTLARVLASVNLGAIPSGQVVLGFSFTGLGQVDGLADDPRSLAMLDELHHRIREMYTASVVQTSEGPP